MTNQFRLLDLARPNQFSAVSPTILHLNNCYGKDPLTVEQRTMLGSLSSSTVGREALSVIKYAELKQWVIDTIEANGGDLAKESYHIEVNRIAEMLLESDATQDDLLEFISEYGVTWRYEQPWRKSSPLLYFDEWVAIREDDYFDSELLESYLDHFGLDDLSGYEDRLFGRYDSKRELIEEMLDAMGQELPNWVDIDVESTIEYLEQDFIIDQRVWDNLIVWSNH